MKTPLFSIVLVNYNHGQYLEEAIKSVLLQSCSDFEFIIVDGGSNDNSLDIIKKYEDKLAYWISEKDNGQSDAFNKGFRRAKGEFYFWLNADDVLLPHSIKYSKDAIRKNKTYRWFVGNTIFINEDGIIQKCARGLPWNSYLIKNGQIYVYGPTAIFHRNLFEQLGGFDERLFYTMDTDLWMRLVNMGYKFKRINKYIWTFRIHNDSKTSHALIDRPSEKFQQEQDLIARENKLPITRGGVFKQTVFKILAGTYMLSLIDTIKLKGKSYLNFYTETEI